MHHSADGRTHEGEMNIGQPDYRMLFASVVVSVDEGSPIPSPPTGSYPYKRQGFRGGLMSYMQDINVHPNPANHPGTQHTFKTSHGIAFHICAMIATINVNNYFTPQI